jgi:hypothetical protein
LDSDTQFQRTYEDIYKEPKMGFFEEQEIEGEVKKVNKEMEIIKEENEFVAFEEYVNSEKGCWIEFNKSPVVEEEDPKAKKGAAPKGKKGQVEVSKPVYGRAWVDFQDFIQPGGAELIQRCFVNTRKIEKKEEEEEVKDEDPQLATIFEDAKTYIYLKLNLSSPINPEVPEEPAPSPSELIAKRPPVPKFPTTKESCEDFRLQVELAVEAISKEYQKMISEEAEDPKAKQKEQQLSEKQQRVKREGRKEKFLYEFNTSGKYHILKQKLKKTIVRIVREKFKKKGSLTGVTKDEKDEFYSSLYAFLIEQMHKTVESIVHQKKELLHEDIIVSKLLANKEREVIISKTTKETLNQKYYRLAREYQRAHDYQVAQKYILDLLNLDQNDPQIWRYYARFSLQIGELTKAEECIRNCISIDNDNNEYFMLYAGLLTIRRRFKEAVIFLNRILEKEFTDKSANILIGLMYELDEHKGLMRKHFAIAKRQKQRELGLLPPKGTLLGGKCFS